MRLPTSFYTLLAGAITAALAAPAPAPAPAAAPQGTIIILPLYVYQKNPAGYFCGTGINRVDAILQCNPNGSSRDGDDWVFIGDCRPGERCWEDGNGLAFCRSQ
jgi:hypothetical protein